MMKHACKKSLLPLVLVLVLVLGQTAVFADTQLPKRSEVGERYKWDLTEIYESREAFEEDMNKIRNDLLPKVKAFKGKLGHGDKLLAYLELDEKVSRILYKGYVYAHMSLDLNQADSNAQEMASIAGSVYSDYQQVNSFVNTEILSLSEEELNNLLEDTKLATYKLYLEKLLKQKEHVLSQKEEGILSAMSELADSPNDIFNKVIYADFEYPTIRDPEGNEVKLTNAIYYRILEEADRDYRKRAYGARLESYGKIINTLAATYSAEIKKNIFFAETRKYNSSMEAALSREYISKDIYDNLVSAVNNNLEYLHKYYAVKKEVLGLDELHGYDASIPVVEDYKMEITFEEAIKIISKGLEPLGETYVNAFKRGMNSKWVDVYEDDNKYTGAYSWGSYDTHPYILMNYKNDLDSVLTLAHEMGHALNSKYSSESQDYINADYPIFTAEVASTANELLVMDYLIKNAKDDQEKLYLLNKQIENIRGTIYSQVMFSEFEKRAHELSESGKPLSAKVFNDLWLEIIKKYNGDAYTVDADQKYTWSRVSHFYMNFYVYKYATAMSASFALVNDIIAEEEGAVDRYLEFLSAGGSDYPVNILKKAGVDMTSTEPVDDILTYFGKLVNEMENLLLAEEPSNKKETIPKDQVTYIVQPKDVLWKIAEAFGTTWEVLAEINNLNDPNLIVPGRELIVSSY